MRIAAMLSGWRSYQLGVQLRKTMPDLEWSLLADALAGCGVLTRDAFGRARSYARTSGVGDLATPERPTNPTSSEEVVCRL
jgi:hypothetical protein